MDPDVFDGRVGSGWGWKGHRLDQDDVDWKGWTRTPVRSGLILEEVGVGVGVGSGRILEGLDPDVS